MNVPAAENLRHTLDVNMAAEHAVAAADLLDAIDALPDDSPHDPVFSPAYLHGYREAMRRVKALLHPAPKEDK